MARLEKKVLGEIRGRIGDIVGKVRNGKQYIASRPTKYTMSKAPHEIDKRSRFKVNGLFAKAIKKSELLYKVWEKNKAPAASAYNKICMVNFKLCRIDRPSEQNVITPNGFDLEIINITSLPGGVELELELFDILEAEKRIMFIMFVSFYEPEKKEINFFEAKRIKEYVIDGMRITFNYDSADRLLANAYKKRTVFFAAVTEDADGNIIRFSSTIGRDL